MLKVLHLAKKENQRLTVANAKLADILTSYSELKYQVQFATDVCVGSSQAPATWKSTDSDSVHKPFTESSAIRFSLVMTASRLTLLLQ